MIFVLKGQEIQNHLFTLELGNGTSIKQLPLYEQFSSLVDYCEPHGLGKPQKASIQVISIEQRCCISLGTFLLHILLYQDRLAFAFILVEQITTSAWTIFFRKVLQIRDSV